MDLSELETDFERLTRLASILTARATGNPASDADYELLRQELVANIEIRDLLPDWVILHRNLDSFWGFIQPKYETYADRRRFIAEQFNDALSVLEFGHVMEVSKNPLPRDINNMTVKNNAIFIVHGHDNEVKQEVARYVESIGIEAIILHEQPSSGKTIIEKIEHYSRRAKFALVLYTACDHGRGVKETKIHPKNRARQNVVFEHGYLMAKFGRDRVCALVKGNIETPNDISGVVYVTLDDLGAWKQEVRKELKACGYEI